MSRTNIWFPFYVGDYLSEVLGLSHDERGIYVDLLCAYCHRQAPLPDDDKQLAKLANLSPQKWKKIRPSIARIFTINHGLWTLPRLDKQIAHCLEVSEKRRVAGRLGGQKSWAKRQASAEASASNKSKQMLNKSVVSSQESECLLEKREGRADVLGLEADKLVGLPRDPGGAK